MAYTKEQILQLTGGSSAGADIYKASQQHGFSAQDVDQAFGFGSGTSQSWIDKNIAGGGAGAGSVSLNAPPVTTTAAPAAKSSDTPSYLDSETSKALEQQTPASSSAAAVTTPTTASLEWSGGKKIANAQDLQNWVNYAYRNNDLDPGEISVSLQAANQLGIPVDQLIAMTGGKATKEQLQAYVAKNYPNTQAYQDYANGTVTAGQGTTAALSAKPDQGAPLTKQGQVNIRDYITSNLAGKTITADDASQLYSMATAGGLTAEELAAAAGIPVEAINSWLTQHGLSLSGKQSAQVGLNAAPGVKPVTKEVQPNQTAAYQLAQLISSNSPYIKINEQKGLNTAASRHLLNSSIAVGAARKAAIDAAGPLAINDANTFSRQAIANQDAENQAGITNAQLQQSNVENVRSNETSRLNQLAQNETQMNLQKLSSASQERLEQFRVQADIDINDRNTRSNAFSNLVVSIGNIEASADLNTQQKNEAITRTVAYYKEFMDYLDALLGNAA